jgi:hypothetical protein
MKYKVSWNSPSQGIQSTTVDALGPMQAEEQVKSLYAHIKDFRMISVSPVFEKRESYETEPSWQSDSSPYDNDSDSEYDGDVSAGIAGVGIFIAGCVILVGLFTLPVGIGAMIIGGAIGWLSWKLGEWLYGKGW